MIPNQREGKANAAVIGLSVLGLIALLALLALRLRSCSAARRAACQTN